MNDAVIQGLSAMQDISDWAVLAIGTGPGDASSRNKTKQAAGD